MTGPTVHLKHSTGRQSLFLDAQALPANGRRFCSEAKRFGGAYGFDPDMRLKMVKSDADENNYHDHES